MKKIITLFTLTLISLSGSSQCDIKTNNLPNGGKVEYMNPLPIHVFENIEVGISVNKLNSIYSLGVSTRFPSRNSQKTKGSIKLRLNNNTTISLNLFATKNVIVAGEKCNISTYQLSTNDITKLKKNLLLGIVITYEIMGTYYANVERNHSVILEQLNCLEKNKSVKKKPKTPIATNTNPDYSRSVDMLNNLVGLKLYKNKLSFKSNELEYLNTTGNGQVIYTYAGANKPKEIFGVPIDRILIGFDNNSKVNTIQIMTKENYTDTASASFLYINKTLEKIVGTTTKKGKGDTSESDVLFYSEWEGAKHFLSVMLFYNSESNNGKLYSTITLLAI